MAVTATLLRENVYRILDAIIETGQPVDIERGGRRLRIILLDGPGHRLDRLEAHPGAITGDRDDLVHLDWSLEWTP